MSKRIVSRRNDKLSTSQRQCLDYLQSMLGEMHRMASREGLAYTAYLIEVAHVEVSETLARGPSLAPARDRTLTDG